LDTVLQTTVNFNSLIQTRDKNKDSTAGKDCKKFEWKKYI